MFVKIGLQLLVEAVFISTLFTLALSKVVNISQVSRLIVFLGIVCGLLFVKVDDISAVMALHGLIADVSIVSMVFVFVFFVQHIFRVRLNMRARSWELLILIIFATVLFCSAEGILRYDIYRYGYNYALVSTIIVCLGLIALRWSKNIASIAILCMLAYVLRLMPSENFFDYFVDMPLWLGAILAILWRIGLRTSKYWNKER